MAEAQDSTNLLKRTLHDTEEAGLKRQRLPDGETDEFSGDTAVILQELNTIGADVSEILENAENEKARIAREAEEAVQKRFQDRARILEQLPGFWRIALRQSLAGDYITEDDDKLLEYLVSVDVANVENQLHISLQFAEDNPFLQSTVITRTVSPYDQSIPTEVSAITWKPGQELSPATDDSGAGTFDSCNFFQRITCVPNFDTVDQVLHNIFWDPMKYYRGTADLAAERQQVEFVEEVEDEEQEEEALQEQAALEEQYPAVVEEGSSGEDAASDGEEELNIEDQEVEEEDDEDPDADGDDDGADAL